MGGLRALDSSTTRMEGFEENGGLDWQPSFSRSSEEVSGEARKLAPLSNNLHVQAVSEPGPADRCLLEKAHFDFTEIIPLSRKSVLMVDKR